MPLFDKFNDSVIFDNPCPPGCETCCPLDIQLAYDPVTNIFTLTYIYDNATVVRTVNLTDLQEPLTIGLTFNPTTNIITLAGTYAGIPFSSNIDISHNFDLELILNGTILELTGEHDGVQVITSVDLAPIIPVVPVGLFFSEDNITYYDASGTLLLTEYIIVATQNLIDITLPANPILGQMYKIYNTTNSINVLPNSGQQIGSLLSLPLSLDESVILQYIKTNIWGVIKI
jgi:hypothetical protein